jgi:hypothetical protein
MDRPNSFDVSVVGDLTGHGAWTLTAGDRASTSASTGA